MSGPADADFPIRACAWPRMAPDRPPRVRLIEPAELPTWILREDERVLVINKPGDVVVHPSKAGPWSSLVGAVREYTALPMVHLIFRLDRETSGVVVVAKDAALASKLQTAMQERRVGKRYLAILTGELREAVTVNQPLGPDRASPVFVKSCVVEGPDSQTAVTHYEPLVSGGGYTLVRVRLETGRKHQIRAHAQWLGYPVVGDKIYGPDARLYLDFIDRGWDAALAARLPLPRQALHCAEITIEVDRQLHVFTAPLPADLRAFIETTMSCAVPDWPPPISSTAVGGA